MKKQSQIKQQLKQVIFRHRKRFVVDGLKQRPVNCKHNGVIRLPVHTANRATIHICTWGVGHVKDLGKDHDGDGWNNRVCDSSMGGDQQAQECPFFECMNTADSLKEEFSEQLGLDGVPVAKGVLARDYPDVAALLWVLGPGESMRSQKEDEPSPNILAFFNEEMEDSSES